MDEYRLQVYRDLNLSDLLETSGVSGIIVKIILFKPYY
jgi:hypothetical protein